MRHIKDTSLEEENKRYPLIVCLVLDLILLCLLIVRSDSWQYHLLVIIGRQGEGSHDVAIGVHDMLGDGPGVGMTTLGAGNVETIAHILHTGDQDTADQQDEAGHSEVQLGDDTLRLWVDNLM